jgi:hypothetical protein
MPATVVFVALTTPPSVMLELPAAATPPAVPATLPAVPAALPAVPAALPAEPTVLAVPAVPPAPEPPPSLAGISFRKSASNPNGARAPRTLVLERSSLR